MLTMKMKLNRMEMGTGPVQTLLRRRALLSESGESTLTLPDGMACLMDERNKKLLDEEQAFLLDRKDGNE